MSFAKILLFYSQSRTIEPYSDLTRAHQLAEPA